MKGPEYPGPAYFPHIGTTHVRTRYMRIQICRKVPKHPLKTRLRIESALQHMPFNQKESRAPDGGFVILLVGARVIQINTHCIYGDL